VPAPPWSSSTRSTCTTGAGLTTTGCSNTFCTKNSTTKLSHLLGDTRGEATH
jgi:hypothetical protein